MQYRKYSIETGEVYHVMTKSIAGYEVFGNMKDRSRMLMTIKYYQVADPGMRLSYFLKGKDQGEHSFYNSDVQKKDRIVDIIAYCLMPTHIHLILKQLKQDGIAIFMSKVLNSYTRYLNIRRDRKGPLWEGRFKNVIVDSNEQLLHLTRYIHLNPVTAGLVDAPEQWQASSYREFISVVDEDSKICSFENLPAIDPEKYREFVMNRREYQKELALLKHIIVE
jgi:putative transposase